MAKSLLLGADPEFFLKDSATGKLVSAVGMLGGTKAQPRRLPGLPAGFAVQEDNIMAEFNIPPCDNSKSFVGAIRGAIPVVLAEASARYGKPLGILTRPAVRAQASLLDCEEARRFGCDPDFDAYQMGERCPLIEPSKLRTTRNAEFRFAGGHLHLGYKHAVSNIPDFVAAAFCDALISLPIVAQGWDKQQNRRGFYGTPGRFRGKEYGIEYRTLSNAWLYDNSIANVANWAFHCMTILSTTPEHSLREWYNAWPWVAIQAAIKSEDHESAGELYNDLYRSVERIRAEDM